LFSRLRSTAIVTAAILFLFCVFSSSLLTK
jgi:hypothetical protein